MAEIFQDWPQKLLLASPRGFCAGVDRIIRGVERSHEARQQTHPGSITYVFHEAIHNKPEVERLKRLGIVSVNNISEIPDGADAWISAHGASPQVYQEAQTKGLDLIDGTCPLVKKPHDEVKRYVSEGREILYICHFGHDEAVGLVGEAPESIISIQTEEDVDFINVKDPTKLALLTQTTLSMDDTAKIRAKIKERFPDIIEPPRTDICYATQNRQNAVKTIVQKGAEVVVVVGSQNSSNSLRLAEVAITAGAVRSFLVDGADELDKNWFIGIRAVGLTAGASGPEYKFQEVVSWFQERGCLDIQEVKVADESMIHFAPPQRPPLI